MFKNTRLIHIILNCLTHIMKFSSNENKMMGCKFAQMIRPILSCCHYTDIMLFIVNLLILSLVTKIKNLSFSMEQNLNSCQQKNHIELNIDFSATNILWFKMA